MESIENIMNYNEYNKRCADAIRTLRLFVANAEEQLDSTLPISTIKLVLDSINEER